MLSLSHLIVILLILLLLFGAGKLPSVMADLAKGIKSFKKNLDSEDLSEAQNLSNNLDKQNGINIIKDVTAKEFKSRVNVLENKSERKAGSNLINSNDLEQNTLSKVDKTKKSIKKSILKNTKNDTKKSVSTKSRASTKSNKTKSTKENLDNKKTNKT